MVVLTCVDKCKSPSGDITHLVLQEVGSDKRIQMTKDQLKLLITNKKVEVTNLKVDNGGRLVDRNPKEFEDSRKSENTPPKKTDITNEELLDQIRLLEEQGNKALANLIKGLYQKQLELDQKIQNISSQNTRNPNVDLAEKQEIRRALGDILGKLQNNDAAIGRLENSIQNIKTSLDNIDSNTDEDKDKPSVDNHKIPESDYEKLFFNRYRVENPLINNGMTTQELTQALAGLSWPELQTLGVTPELLSDLSVEIESAKKAYKQIESLYTANLKDYSDKVSTLTFVGTCVDGLGTVVGNISKFGEVGKNLLIGAIPDLVLNFGKVDNTAGFGEFWDYKRSLHLFGDNKKMSLNKRSSLVTGTNGIWNCVIDYIDSDPDWEIKLYVVQSLNHIYFNIANTGTDARVLNSDRGNKVSTQGNKYLTKSNSFCEKALKSYSKWFEDRCNVEDTDFKYIKPTYDASIIAYFAAKKLLYSCGKYPYDTNSRATENGALVLLASLGMLMMSVSEQRAYNAAEQIIKSIKYARFNVDIDISLQYTKFNGTTQLKINRITR